MHLNVSQFQLELQFVTKQNYSFLLGKATFGTRCIIHDMPTVSLYMMLKFSRYQKARFFNVVTGLFGSNCRCGELYTLMKNVKSRT
jgi:hypothetical protein